MGGPGKGPAHARHVRMCAFNGTGHLVPDHGAGLISIEPVGKHDCVHGHGSVSSRLDQCSGGIIVEQQAERQIEHFGVAAHQLVQIDGLFARQAMKEDLEGAGHDLGGGPVGIVSDPGEHGRVIFPSEVVIDILIAPSGAVIGVERDDRLAVSAGQRGAAQMQCLEEPVHLRHRRLQVMDIFVRGVGGIAGDDGPCLAPGLGEAEHPALVVPRRIAPAGVLSVGGGAQEDGSRRLCCI